MIKSMVWRGLSTLVFTAAMVMAVECDAKVTRSLSTKFVEVLVEGVPVGSRYVLEAKAVEVMNKSEFAMKLRYDAVTPRPAEMRAGYEPIPDPAWVSFEPRTFDVEKGESAVGKVVLYIPDDEKLVGRRFQVMLHLHGDSRRGSLLSIGLKPRLMFSIREKNWDPGKARVVDFPQRKASVLPYEVASDEGYITFDCGTFKASNPWKEDMTYEVVEDAEAYKRIDVRPYESLMPDASWVTVLPQVLVLPTYTKADFAVTVRLPIAPEHFGKTYVAAVHTVARRAGAKTVDVYSKVRVVVPDLPLSTSLTGEVESAK